MKFNQINFFYSVAPLLSLLIVGNIEYIFQSCPIHKPKAHDQFVNYDQKQQNFTSGVLWCLLPEVHMALINCTYLLVTEFEGRTVSYGPSFFLLEGEKTRIRNLQYGPIKRG